MKIFRKVVFLLPILFVTHLSQAQVTNPDSMVHKIFTILKNKDEKAYVALYPNQDQMIKLLNKLVSGLAMQLQKLDTSKKEIRSEDFSKMMLEELQKKASPHEMTKLYKGFAKNFNRIIETGEEKGIDWNRVVLSRYTYDTVLMKDEPMIKLFGSDQYRSMNGTIFFTSADSAWQINFKEVIYLPEEGGWYGAELRQLKKPGTLDEDFSDDLNVEDIKIGSVSQEGMVEPPPPPPKAQTKTTSKTKTPTSKSKTKTKS